MGKNYFFSQRSRAASKKLTDGFLKGRALFEVKPSLGGRGRARTLAKGKEADLAKAEA